MPEKSKNHYAGISILYVEDEAATREQVAHLLSSRGYALTIANNGEQGLDYFQNLTPDIVLTDIMMPRLSGLDMARNIRNRSPETQIACMTAISETSCLIDAIDIGINQFILKPVEFRRLYAALDRCQEMVDLRRRQKLLEAENQRAKKNEAVAILAGGMAHDFNNLMQVILGYVSLARMCAEPGGKTEALLTVAEQSSDRARELGAQLLTFAKGCGASMKPAQTEPLIRERVAAELNCIASIKTFIDLPEKLPLAMIDSDHISQALTNLLINAREAMPDGGAFRVSAAAVPLDKSNDFGLPGGNYLHLLFEDSGIGIPPEHLPRIFDPYFSTKAMGSKKGTGLGLALCHSIIKHHNGHIQAESTPGLGTRMHLYLPAHEPEE